MKKILIAIILLLNSFSLIAQLACDPICEGEDNPLICAYTTDPGGVVIEWDTGDTGNCFTPADSAPGTYTYTVTVTDPAGICDPLEGTVEFTIEPIPEVECQGRIGRPGNTFMTGCEHEVCEGTPFVLNVLGEDAADLITWAGDLPAMSGMSYRVLETTVAGIYNMTATITTPAGCEVTLDFVLTIHPTPELDCSDVVDTCGGATGSIMAVSTVPGGTWTIDPAVGTNDGNGNFSDLPAGVYTITQITDAGCEATCEAEVEESTLPPLELNCTPQN